MRRSPVLNCQEKKKYSLSDLNPFDSLSQVLVVHVRIRRVLEQFPEQELQI